MTFRLAIVASHPIQYNSNWFRALADEPSLDVQVYYCHNPTAREQADAGFGVEFVWDRPLLEGYSYRFLRNASKNPSLHHFRGLQIPEIFNIVRATRPHALMVLGWLWQSDWQAMAACWRTRTPLLVRGDSILATARSPWKRLAKEVGYRVFLKRASACLAVGTRSREYFVHFGVDPSKVFFVPHSVDDDFFQAEYDALVPRRAELRAGWNIEGHGTCFLFSGKLLPRKRPLDFIEALAKARKSGANVAGLIVGDGPLREACATRARELKAPVVFAGFLNQSRIAEPYVAADVLVLPSDARETWGLVVNEAMWCHRPAIVSDSVGCAPDLVLPKMTGDIYHEGSVASLAELMTRYASEDIDVGNLGEAARQHINGFSTAAAVTGVLEATGSIFVRK